MKICQIGLKIFFLFVFLPSSISYGGSSLYQRRKALSIIRKARTFAAKKNRQILYKFKIELPGSQGWADNFKRKKFFFDKKRRLVKAVEYGAEGCGFLSRSEFYHHGHLFLLRLAYGEAGVSHKVDMVFSHSSIRAIHERSKLSLGPNPPSKSERVGTQKKLIKSIISKHKIRFYYSSSSLLRKLHIPKYVFVLGRIKQLSCEGKVRSKTPVFSSRFLSSKIYVFEQDSKILITSSKVTSFREYFFQSLKRKAIKKGWKFVSRALNRRRKLRFIAIVGNFVVKEYLQSTKTTTRKLYKIRYKEGNSTQTGWILSNSVKGKVLCSKK